MPLFRHALMLLMFSLFMLMVDAMSAAYFAAAAPLPAFEAPLMLMLTPPALIISMLH